MKFLLLAVLCGLCVSTMARPQPSKRDDLFIRRQVLRGVLYATEEYAKSQGVQEKFLERFAELRSQIASTIGLPRDQAMKVLDQVQQKYEEIIEDIGNEISQDNYSTSVDDKVPVFLRRQILRGVLYATEEYAKSQGVQEKFAERFAELRSQITSTVGLPRDQAMKVLDQVQQKYEEIVEDIGNEISQDNYSTSVDDKVSVFIRRQILRGVLYAAEEYAKSQGVQEKFAERFAELRSQITSTVGLPRDQAMKVLDQVQQKYEEIVEDIGNEISQDNYSTWVDDRLPVFLRRQILRGALNAAEEFVKSQGVQEKFAERFAELKSQIKSTVGLPRDQALKILNQVQQKYEEIVEEIGNEISQDNYSTWVDDRLPVFLRRQILRGVLNAAEEFVKSQGEQEKFAERFAELRSQITSTVGLPRDQALKILNQVQQKYEEIVQEIGETNHEL